MRVFSLCTFLRFENNKNKNKNNKNEEYFTIILAVKESFEWFSGLEFVFKKSKHREAGLKHKLLSLSLKTQDF